ncbi:MAG: efflux RND transporter permease subunit [Spirochaetaceae bacterium]|jgi:HAE1 family hydrophobic/amphiphilic exporter-1|nr:efflux RND transporter permease subunit [Spirochaetaceae bacterium]
MSIAKAVVKRPVLWLVVFVLVCISGVFLFSSIAFDMLPEVEVPYLAVVTTYPGADPETVEKSVTDVIEAGLANTGGINKMTSVSREQSSMILLEFDFGTDIDVKANEARGNIDLIKSTLPDNAAAPMVLQIKANDQPIMLIGISGSGFSQNELRAYAKDELQNQLKQIEGVASCDVEGGQDALVRVAISQNRLEAYGVTISEIAGKLAAQNIQLGAGSIEEGLVEYSIKTSGEYDSVAAISNTVVAQMNGADIRLGDIGDVAMDYAEERSAAYINGEPGVYLSIMKQSGANTVQVADHVYRRLETLRKTLPQGVSLDIIQDDTTQIRAMILELVNSAVMGVVFAMIILFLFFRNLNSSIIVGLSIPISFLITLLVMSLVHITINMMTLAGLILGLGMIVDSSIVVLEGVTKFREKGEPPSIAAILAGEEVMSSIIASTITTICVFLPVLLFKDRLEIIGLFIQDMLFTIVISLVSSLLVAIFLVPVLASKWLPVHSRLQKPVRNRFIGFIDRGIAAALDGLGRIYSRLLTKSLKHRLITILLVIAAFTGSVLALSKMDIRTFPDMNSDTITVDITMPLGTRYEDTKAVALDIQEYAIAEIVGTKNITARIGSGESIVRNAGNNTASVTVTLDLDNPQADSSSAVKEKLRRHFSAFPNADIAFSEGDFTALSGADIDIVIQNDDLDRGLDYAAAVKALLEDRVPEARDIAVDVNSGLPQVRVNIDRQRAYNMGLSVSAIAGEIAASMNGVTATTFRQDGDEYDVVLQLAKEDRYELPDLGKIFVRSSKGALFPVSNFADFEKAQGPERINHEGQGRTIHVTADLREGASLKAVEAAIRSLLAGQGIDASFAGESAETGKMLQTFMLIIILALLLVFGVMAAQYESFRDPIINFCTIPLVLIGVVVIHLATGQAMNAFTMIGFVMLVGIVVNNGILLVDYTNLLRRRGMPLMEACFEAGVSRFRPVLMTALTTMLGLAPMAFFPGKSSMMTAPIGLAVFGGLASATVITLFFIPVMYSLINREKMRNEE